MYQRTTDSGDQESDLIIQVPKDTVVCTSIFVDSYFENAARVDWSFSPTFSPIAISNVSDFYIGLPPAPFDLIMYVRAESPNGCIAVDTLRILKRDIPINAAFQFSIDQCEDSLLVDFINTTTIPQNLTLSDWLWDLSNGQQATTQDIQALQYSPDSLRYLDSEYGGGLSRNDRKSC